MTTSAAAEPSLPGRSKIARKIRSALGRLGLAERPQRPHAAIRHGGQRPERLEIDKWWSSELVLRLAGVVGTQPYPLDELMLMAAAFEHHRPALVVDIGTHVGKSARIWWELSQAFGTPCQIHTIDLHDPRHVEYPGHELGQFIRGLDVQQHLGDGCEIARRLLEGRSGGAVLLYVDGDHEYATVAKELTLLDQFDDGCALVHDTFYQPTSTYNHGPHLAIRDFLARNPVKQVIELTLGLPGMTYLGKS